MTRHEINANSINKIWEHVAEFYNNIQTGININNAPPGGGKTTGFIQHIKKHSDIKYVYFSSNHEQLSRVGKELKKERLSFVHWEGFTRKCFRYPKTADSNKWSSDEKFVYRVYHSFPNCPRFICASCNKKGCDYQGQFKTDKKIVLSPLEFLLRKNIDDKFTEFWIDESVGKIVHFNWDFDFKKIISFLNSLENITGNKLKAKDKFINSFLKLHQHFLLQTSIIFTRPFEELLDFNDKKYRGEEWVSNGYLQNHSRVTHYAEIDMVKIFAYKKFRLEEKRFLLHPKLRNMIVDFATKGIRQTIENNNVDDIIDYFIDIENFYNIIDIIMRYDLAIGGCIVTENIEIIEDPSYVKKKVIIESCDSFERGFFEDKPYLFDKKTNRYFISSSGKEYSEGSNSLVRLKECWLTFGLPYMMTVFSIAEKKAVILMDATFNENIYNKIFYRYLNTKLDDSSSLDFNEQILDKIKISRKTSQVFNIQYSKHHDTSYPLESLESGAFLQINDQLKKIMSLLKKDGTVGAIMHKKFEEGFKLCKTNHFFNQRGTNKFKDDKTLIIIGTPYVPPYQLLFSYVLNFGKIPKDTSVIKDKQHNFQGYKDTFLQELLVYEVFNELYQAIHRCRPLLGDKKIICYCKLPEKIKDELTIKKMTFDNLYAELQGKKVYYQQHLDEVVKLIVNDNVTQNLIKNICNSNPKSKENYAIPLVIRLAKIMDLSSDDPEIIGQILLDALSPIKIKIVNLLKRTRYKRMGLTKLHSGTRSPRVVVNLCLWLLEKEDFVEIKVGGNKKEVILKKLAIENNVF